MARDLRKRLSPPEIVLWHALRGRKLGGLKFRRQHPIGPYVVDFFCSEIRLAVEVDGAMHDDPDRMRRDARRNAFLKHQRVRVLRLPARYVLENPDGAARMIARAAQTPGIVGEDT
jgi:ATP-dependent DNA helicase RecQ